MYGGRNGKGGVCVGRGEEWKVCVWGKKWEGGVCVGEKCEEGVCGGE